MLLISKASYLIVYANPHSGTLNDRALLQLLLLQDDKGKSKCFGFVNFAEPDAANKAVESMTGKEVNGKSLYAGRAQKKAEREVRSFMILVAAAALPGHPVLAATSVQHLYQTTTLQLWAVPKNILL